MFQGLDPATGELRCAPLWRAPRSRLAAGPLLEALKGDVRSAQAACRASGRFAEHAEPERSHVSDNTARRDRFHSRGGEGRQRVWTP
jgi:hypothetical protein